MLLEKLSILNFKNIEQAQIEFSPTVNVLVGDNGAGKTNVVDAVHYLSLSRSLFSMTDRQSVRHEAPFFVLEGQFLSDQGRHEAVLCSFSRQASKGVKSFKRNGKEYERLSDHVGVIPVVVVTPQDASLIYDGAEERRRFLNSSISQIDKQYLSQLIRYNATLGQRNTLLKGRVDESMLAIYDQQLSASAYPIHQKRLEVVERMRPLVEEFYLRLSGGREQISLSYNSSLGGEASFEELLLGARPRDLALQYSSVGVHRDDLELTIEGMPLRKYGSQGQQKSMLIALKLAQYKIVSEMCGERPILLLDDLFDRLDAHRVSKLLEIVSGDDFGQIFITDCNGTRLEEILGEVTIPYTLFQVEKGEINCKS